MSDQIDRTVLPIRRPPFRGVANQTLGGSQPDWGVIGHAKPPAGAPNVLLVLIDDAGFGNPTTFGGPIASGAATLRTPTPTLAEHPSARTEPSCRASGLRSRCLQASE